MTRGLAAFKRSLRPPVAPDSRPPLAFRVGITGSRHLKPEEIEALRAPVASVLRRVRDTITGLASEKAARAVYRQDTGAPSLRLISPLAVGADRLVAEEALKLTGYSLFAPLPFPQADYETDFPDSVEPFRHLLDQAQVFALDGGRGDEDASYESVGRFVARNGDLLIALWDGTSVKKRGGTGQIVSFAVRENVPVWWIDSASGGARFITTAAQLRRHDLAPGGAAAEAALLDYITAIVLPPKAPHPDRHGIMGRAAHRFCRLKGYEAAPMPVYLAEPALVPSGGLWRAFGLMLDAVAPPPRPLHTKPTPAPDLHSTLVEDWWRGLYDRADGLSIAYGDRYRSSYVLIIGLAFLALSVAAIGGHLAGSRVAPFATLVELGLLFGIGALVWENHVRFWQERWITYRLLAELCRKQMVLAPLGRTLPGTEVTRSAAEAAADHEPAPARGKAAEHDPPALPREAWVGWYFLANLRAAPFPQGDAKAAAARALAVGQTLVKDQKTYHEKRRDSARRAERRLAGVGEMLFLATIVGLVLRLFFFAEDSYLEAGEWIETIAILVSGASAAFVGLRAYTEFALIARQSRRMRDLMSEVAAELDGLDPGAPLASQDLGGVLHRLAMAMMQEVRGWAQLFRLKSVETG